MHENWYQLLEQQEHSGLEPKEFCRAHGIDSQRFGYQRWRTRGSQRRERFIRVDGATVTLVKIVVKDGVMIRTPPSAIREALEVINASRYYPHIT